MNRTIFLTSFFILLALVFSFGLHKTEVSAQSSIPSLYPDVITEKIDVNMSPAIPGPNEDVALELEAYGTDLNAATITWTANGKLLKSGIGEKRVVFKLGNVGETTTVTISIKPRNGSTLTKRVVIIPEEVDLIWEANTYTPAFYSGKALFTAEAEIKMVALPNFIVSGRTIDPSTLIYKWSLNNSVYADRSGYGKNTFTFTGSLISKPVLIKVDVSSTNGQAVATKSMMITPTGGKALIYEVNPLYGILFNNAIKDSYNLSGQEVKFEAFPFYFSGDKSSTSPITYAWKLNGSKILVPQEQHTMTFRNDKGDSGNGVISLDVANKNKVLQNASTKFTINYFSSSRGFFNSP